VPLWCHGERQRQQRTPKCVLIAAHEIADPVRCEYKPSVRLTALSFCHVPSHLTEHI